MRMFVSEMQNSQRPQRLWYFGNCFRYERPQKGRFREFWQMGAELIGGAKPDSEAEAIALADGMLRACVAGDIHVGYLGLIRSLLGKIGEEHRSRVMRMIDKKERSALAALLNDRAEPSRSPGLIDLKGQPALDKATESPMIWAGGPVRCFRRESGLRLLPSHWFRLGAPRPSGWGRAAAGRIPGNCGSSVGLWCRLHH